ncbi:right-handed parallel beta-helix repeat-containing protein [Sphingomonas oligophenolica]|uniref:Right-handed parallel beta-helix repeat-containing protein n=1 Tax=Sphingomonas oligophenolica TaxID=301154 RepID=A0ABU9YCY4_9SPHN
MTIFVAPDGMANASGTQADPISFEKASGMIGARNQAVTLNLLPGLYKLKAPIKIVSRNGQVLIRAFESGTVILDGAGTVAQALYLGGKDISVEGLTIRNFSVNGILIQGGSNISISRNRLSNITSTNWSQAAIHGLTFVRNVMVKGNIIDGADYDGILFDSSATGVLENISIERNTVLHTCRKVKDCGAIHASGRSPNSLGMKITGNIIRDFGGHDGLNKAIYLDDGLSGVVVQANRISGPGSYAFHVNGGADNVIKANEIDLRKIDGLLFYQHLRLNRSAMESNVFTGNRVTRSAPSTRGDVVYSGDTGKIDSSTTKYIHAR